MRLFLSLFIILALSGCASTGKRLQLAASQERLNFKLPDTYKEIHNRFILNSYARVFTPEGRLNKYSDYTVSYMVSLPETAPLENYPDLIKKAYSLDCKFSYALEPRFHTSVNKIHRYVTIDQYCYRNKHSGTSYYVRTLRAKGLRASHVLMFTYNLPSDTPRLVEGTNPLSEDMRNVWDEFFLSAMMCTDFPQINSTECSAADPKFGNA